MTTEKNAELAWKVFDRIETEVRFAEETGLPMERGWDQAHWISVSLEQDEESACGTTACFAGWTALETGCTPHLPKCELTWYDVRGFLNAHVVEVLTPEDRICKVSEWAQEQLGLNYGERCRLFGSGARTPEQLKAVLEEIFGPRVGEELG